MASGGRHGADGERFPFRSLSLDRAGTAVEWSQPRVLKRLFVFFGPAPNYDSRKGSRLVRPGEELGRGLITRGQP